MYFSAKCQKSRTRWNMRSLKMSVWREHVFIDHVGACWVWMRQYTCVILIIKMAYHISKANLLPKAMTTMINCAIRNMQSTSKKGRCIQIVLCIDGEQQIACIHNAFISMAAQRNAQSYLIDFSGYSCLFTPYWHIEAEAKWPQNSWRRFQKHFLEWKWMNYAYDFTEFCGSR